MGSDKWKNAAVAAVLAFLAAWGGIGCMVTGLDLEADMGVLAIGCAIMAITFCACFQTRLALLPICAAALMIGYWWQQGTLRLSWESLLYEVSALYDKGYGWGLLQWSERHLLPDDLTPALLTLALPIVMAVGAAVGKGRFGWLSALTALLPLFGCVVLKDTVPAEGWLGILLFAVVMILITEHTRRRNLRQANRLTLMLALPLLLALVMMFTLSPQAAYDGQDGAQKLEDFVLGLFNQNEVPELLQGPELIPGDQEKTVHLDSVGKRSDRTETIMTVKAQETTTLYLRGCAYDVYDGTSWSSTPGWNSWSLYYAAGGSEVKSLTIETESIHSVLYFAYVPYDSDAKIVGGRLRNDEDLRRYTVYYQDPITYDEHWDETEETIGGEQLAEYLELPESTRQRALELLTKKVGIPTETTNAGQIWKNAMLICDWVSNRADYDLNTAKMPASQDDFALWFLEKADTGYCVHFASAAVVLLRAAGIPAQYVTGYMVEAKAGQEVAVTAAQAHAWVEVFINGVGWVVLDPTPAASTGTYVPDNTEPQPLPTEPDETTAPTEPDETTAPTRPDETTTPDETTAPNETTPSTGTNSSRPSNTQSSEQTGQGGIGGTGSGTPGRSAFGKLLGGILTVLGWVLALAAGIWLQWRLRIRRQEKRLKTGSPNHRLLTRWQLLERMAKQKKREPEERLYWLAQKAKFSQHRITPDELRTMDEALGTLRRQLRQDSLPRQLLYTLILALY